MTVVHGTYMPAWKEICRGGLNKMARNHMHFAKGYNFQSDSKDSNKEVISGMRMTCDIFIELNIPLAMASGVHFYESKNGVILSEGFEGNMPVCFFKDVYCRADKLSLYKKEVSETLFDLKSVDFTSSVDPYCQGEKLTLGDFNVEETNLKNEKVLIMRNRAGPELISFFSKKYIFVLDFEANCIEKEKMNPQEIVEFPVVPVNALTGEIITEWIFHTYLKPEHIELTPFCTELTGITKDMIKEGVTLEKSLQMFADHLKSINVQENDFVFMTCGDWDLKTCLRKEAGFKKIHLSPCFKRFINIKDVFRRITSQKGKFGMVEMLKFLELSLEGKHHSGIDDSKNIAKIISAFIKNGAIISNWFIKSLE